MDVFIYATPGFGRPLDEVEDALEEFLGDLGEATGSGSGEAGANVDIEVFDSDTNREWLLANLRKILVDLGIPRTSSIAIDGEEYPVYGLSYWESLARAKAGQ